MDVGQLAPVGELRGGREGRALDVPESEGLWKSNASLLEVKRGGKSCSYSS